MYGWSGVRGADGKLAGESQRRVAGERAIAWAAGADIAAQEVRCQGQR